MPIRVLLPMPGEPPISTREPGTMPPPRTRSSSLMPVRMRATWVASTCLSGKGVAAAVPFWRAFAGAVGSGAVSTSVFHSPQPGQRPVQAMATWPQVWQTCRVRMRAM